VAEHLSRPRADGFVDDLVALSDRVLFSAAIPGQGGYGHVNEQPPSYWTERFRAAGMDESPDEAAALRRAFRANGVRAPWFEQNVLVFRAAA
jgi:hypothetical protein